MVIRPVDIWRTPVFQKWVERVWTEEEYSEFKAHVAHYPETGQIVPGTGGVRKIRWGRRGLGKSKGARIIYYFMNRSRPLYLLMGYSKSEKVDLSPADKQWVRAMVKLIKGEA